MGWVTFTEVILNRKFHFWFSVNNLCHTISRSKKGISLHSSSITLIEILFTSFMKCWTKMSIFQPFSCTVFMSSSLTYNKFVMLFDIVSKKRLELIEICGHVFGYSGYSYLFLTWYWVWQRGGTARASNTAGTSGLPDIKDPGTFETQ